MCGALAAAVLLSGSLTASAAGGGPEDGQARAGIVQTDTNGKKEGKDESKATEGSGDNGSLSDARDEISDIKAQRRSAQQRLENLKNDKDNLEAYIRELDENLAEVQEMIRRLTAAMEEKQAVIAQTETEIAQTQADLEAARDTERSQYEAMKLRIQYMYEAGDVEYLELLFASRSLSELLNRTEYITGMMEYDREQLLLYQETCQSIQEAEARLEEEHAKLEQEYAQLEQIKEVNEESKADLEALMDAKNTELDGFASEIDEATTEIENYTRAIKEQEDRIREIEEKIRRQEEEAERRRKEEEERRRKEEEEEERRRQEEESRRQESSAAGAEGGESSGSEGSSGNEGSSETGNGSETGDGSGTEGSTESTGGSGNEGGSENDGGDLEKPGTESFIWPISSTRITSKFGPRKPPIAGASDFHRGIDIGAKSGTDIYAAASGTVVISEYNYSAGNYIMISHGDGLYTVYMHCSKLLVAEGAKVSQGDTIGLVGTTGISTAPHLHFGVRVNGQYVDPLGYVSVP